MLSRRYFLMTGDTGRWYSTKTFQCFRYSKNGPDHSSSACPQTVGRVKWRKNLCITFRLVLYSFIVIWTSAARTMVLVDTGLQLQTWCSLKMIVPWLHWTSGFLFPYCGIIIVRWGPMFVAFVGNPCQLFV